MNIKGNKCTLELNESELSDIAYLLYGNIQKHIEHASDTNIEIDGMNFVKNDHILQRKYLLMRTMFGLIGYTNMVAGSEEKINYLLKVRIKALTKGENKCQ